MRRPHGSRKSMRRHSIPGSLGPHPGSQDTTTPCPRGPKWQTSDGPLPKGAEGGLWVPAQAIGYDGPLPKGAEGGSWVPHPVTKSTQSETEKIGERSNMCLHYHPMPQGSGELCAANSAERSRRCPARPRTHPVPSPLLPPGLDVDEDSARIGTGLRKLEEGG